MRTFKVILLTVLAVGAALMLTSCGAGMDADDYAEIQLDLELNDYGYSEADPAEKLACQLYGYELVDLYDFELQLQIDPELEDEVTEAFIDLAPDADDLAELVDELITLSYPCKEIGYQDRAMLVDTYLGALNEPSWYMLLDEARGLLNANGEEYIRRPEAFEFLDDFDVEPRSFAALQRLTRQRSGPADYFWYDGENPGITPLYLAPDTRYVQEVRFAVLGNLEGEITPEQYVEVHLNALKDILAGNSTAETARAKALEGVEFSAQKLEAFEVELTEYSLLQPVMADEILIRLFDELENYQHSSGLTPGGYVRVVGSADTILQRLYDDEENADLAPEELEKQALVKACECWEVEPGDIEEYEALFTEVWTYLDDKIGPPRVDAEAFVDAAHQVVETVLEEGGDYEQLMVDIMGESGFSEEQFEEFLDLTEEDQELYEETDALLQKKLRPLVETMITEYEAVLMGEESEYEIENLETAAEAVDELTYMFDGFYDMVNELYMEMGFGGPGEMDLAELEEFLMMLEEMEAETTEEPAPEEPQ
ncbi:MAG: hypothetical protein GF399_12180 [Candidatus Coatesbacteria bacterium]|nr:hypothetical protein [Candidatus Coatesbacteria bacterium]